MFESLSLPEYPQARHASIVSAFKPVNEFDDLLFDQRG
jgi:hypothetical protein